MFRRLFLVLAVAIVLFLLNRIFMRRLNRLEELSKKIEPPAAMEFDLVELANLRDSGQLSPEEYEKVKAVTLAKQGITLRELRDFQ